MAENAPSIEELPLPLFGEHRGHPAERRGRIRDPTMEVRQFTRGRRELRTSPGEVVDDADSGVSPMTEEEPWTSRDPWQVHVNENWSTRSSRESQSSYGDSWDQW